MRFFSCLLIACYFLLPVFAKAEEPLIQPGKKTVYERVVSHPGAVLYSDQSARQEISKPRTFTSFYVYEKNDDMLKVGVSASKADGWIKEEDTTYWPQAITMVFTPQLGREPVLFFKNKTALEELCASDGIGAKVKSYLKQLEKGKNADDLPVLAAEPQGKEGEVARKNFYLLPVIASDNQFSEGGTQMLEVACIDPGSGDSGKAGKKDDKSNPGMKTGLVFVIDTTISMSPYIEKTKRIIQKIFDRLQKSPARDNVKVAIVAFRSNPWISPKTEYNAKIISDFMTVADRKKFENLLKKAEEATASTHAFDEDSLAGVQEAIESLSWDGLDAKTMLLITDAGPLGADDPTSGTGMSPEGMADMLKTNDIFLTVAHIKTPAGVKDHRYAERSYKALSQLGNGRASYIAIDAPDSATGAKSFAEAGSIMADKYCEVAELTMQGGEPDKPLNQDIPENASPQEKARRLSEAIGYAMRLRFAGNSNKTAAPKVVSAWIADADLAALEKNPDSAPVPVVEPAVLLTKVQLSQLRKQLKLIINTAEEAFLKDTKDFNFYEQLISAAAQMSRDPDSFNRDPNQNLAQKGVLLEVLDGLPYKSQVLRLGKDDWTNMSTGEQREFVKRLKGLVKRYELYDQDNQHWEGFGSPNKNEWVYRVPLSVLP